MGLAEMQTWGDWSAIIVMPADWQAWAGGSGLELESSDLEASCPGTDDDCARGVHSRLAPRSPFTIAVVTLVIIHGRLSSNLFYDLVSDHIHDCLQQAVLKQSV